MTTGFLNLSHSVPVVIFVIKINKKGEMVTQMQEDS